MKYTQIIATFSAVIAVVAVFFCSKPLEPNAVYPPPAPTGLNVTYDTLRGWAVLRWNPVDVSDVAGYAVYRNDVASPVVVRLTTSPVIGTFFVDTIFTDRMDTANHVFTYRLKSQDTAAHLSAQYSEPVTISAPTPTRVRTFITLHYWGTSNDSASIYDTVTVSLSYYNATRKNIEVRWFINSTRDITALRTVNNAGSAGTDTLLVVWDNPSLCAGCNYYSTNDNHRHRVYAAITDEAQDIWWDSTAVITIVRDVPVADAGSDTTVSPDGTIRLHGSATQRFGTITEWAWDIGNTGTFSVTSGGDTDIVAPAAADSNYVCVLRVTDDDGNAAIDSVKIIVQ